ncbi:MAG TPA: riboflavin synthase [Gemmatimonadales bacterium]|nr:riboflavin synthase [Gemmatimonadales bacterium]
MFTGIVTAVGRVTRVVPADGGVELTVAAPWDDLVLGESIALDGACMTVTAIEPGAFTVHVVRTSLDRTKFGATAGGDGINLERALRAGDRLGGHLVQGHVDGVGTVGRVAERADARLLDLAVPPEVAAVSIPLGSITVDGVSLTVNAIPGPGTIQVSLIPFTLQHTTLGARRAGDRVHLEGDTIGKYVRQLVGAHLRQDRQQGT